MPIKRRRATFAPILFFFFFYRTSVIKTVRAVKTGEILFIL